MLASEWAPVFIQAGLTFGFQALFGSSCKLYQSFLASFSAVNLHSDTQLPPAPRPDLKQLHYPLFTANLGQVSCKMPVRGLSLCLWLFALSPADQSPRGQILVAQVGNSGIFGGLTKAAAGGGWYSVRLSQLREFSCNPCDRRISAGPSLWDS